MMTNQGFQPQTLQNSRSMNLGINPNELRSIYQCSPGGMNDQSLSYIHSNTGFSPVQSHASPMKNYNQNPHQHPQNQNQMNSSERIKQLESKIKEYESKDYEKRINELIEGNNRITKMVTDLSREKDKVTSFFEEKMSVLIDENERLAEIIELKMDSNTVNRTKENNQNSNDEQFFKKKCIELQNEIDLLKKAYSTSPLPKEILEENEKYKTIIEQQSQRLVETSKLELELEKLKSEIKAKDEEISIYKELESNCEKLIQENQKMNSDIEELKRICDDPRLKFGGNDFQNDDSPSKHTNTSRNDEISFLKEVLHQKSRDMDILINENKELEITLSRLKKEFEELETMKLSKIDTSAKMKKSLSNSKVVSNNETKIKDLQTRLTKAESLSKKLEETKKKQGDLIKGYLNENDELRDKCQQYEATLSKFSEIDIEDFHERIEELTCQVESLKNEIQEKEREIDSLREIENKSEIVISANEELNRTIKDLNLELQYLREQLKATEEYKTNPSLQEKFSLLLEEHQALNSNYESKCRELEDYWDIDTKVDLLINENEGLNKLLGEQKKQVDFWQNRCNSMKKVHI